MPVDAIRIDPRDNVATALRELAAGECLTLSPAGESLTALETIPAGHKLAVRTIERGAPVIKYGETIGLATREIAAGGYVHVHNVAGRRGRGDLL